MGISVIRADASRKEFHLVAVGKMSFFPHTLSTISAATVDRLALVQRAEHLAVALL